MVVMATGKIGLGPACAATGVVSPATEVSASAPVASSVLRSSEVMHSSLHYFYLVSQSKGPVRTRALSLSRRKNPLMLDFRRQLAAIGGELGHDLLVQPDVHAGGVVGVTGIAKLLGEFLAGGEAGVDVERLHQVDDRGPPFQLLMLGGHRLVQDRRDVDALRGRRRRRA